MGPGEDEASWRREAPPGSWHVACAQSVVLLAEQQGSEQGGDHQGASMAKGSSWEGAPATHSCAKTHLI